MKECFIFNYLYQYILSLISWEKLLCFHYIKKQTNKQNKTTTKKPGYNVIVDLRNFLFNVNQNVRFSLFAYLRRTQFSCTEIHNFPDDFMSLNEIRNFSHRDWQLCMDFDEIRNCYTEKGFQDQLSFGRDTLFIGWIFAWVCAFSGYPFKN